MWKHIWQGPVNNGILLSEVLLSKVVYFCHCQQCMLMLLFSYKSLSQTFWIHIGNSYIIIPPKICTEGTQALTPTEHILCQRGGTEWRSCAQWPGPDGHVQGGTAQPPDRGGVLGGTQLSVANKPTRPRRAVEQGTSRQRGRHIVLEKCSLNAAGQASAVSHSDPWAGPALGLVWNTRRRNQEAAFTECLLYVGHLSCHHHFTETPEKPHPETQGFPSPPRWMSAV